MTDRDTLRMRFRIANPVPEPDTIDAEELDHILIAIESEWDQARGLAAPSRAQRKARRSRLVPALVFSAAVLLVLLLVGLPILLLSGGEDLSTVEESTTVPTTTVTTIPVTTVPVTVPTDPTMTTSEVPPVALAPVMTWERVPHDPIFEDATIFQVVEGGPGLVAVGALGEWNSFDEISQGAAWVSADGYAWERIDSPAFVSDEYVALFGAAASPDGTIVAFGMFGNEVAFFRSTDGFGWQRIVPDATTGGGWQTIAAVAAAGPGFVAVGEDDVDAAVWLSSDGREWARVGDGALLATEKDELNLVMMDVAAGAPGLVAVGYGGAEGELGFSHTVLWVSADGNDWERLLDREDGPGDSISGDPETGTLIAFGRNMWTSTDGFNWTQTQLQDPRNQPRWQASLAWDGDRVVAGGPDVNLSLWASGDRGETWSRIDPDDPVFDGYRPGISDVVRSGDIFVAVGEAGEYAQEAAAIWIGTWDD